MPIVFQTHHIIELCLSNYLPSLTTSFPSCTTLSHQFFVFLLLSFSLSNFRQSFYLSISLPLLPLSCVHFFFQCLSSFLTDAHDRTNFFAVYCLCCLTFFLSLSFFLSLVPVCFSHQHDFAHFSFFPHSFHHIFSQDGGTSAKARRTRARTQKVKRAKTC